MAMQGLAADLPNHSNRDRHYTLAILVVVYTLSFVDRQILAILFPAIKAEFGVDDWVLGFLAGSAFALFYATLGVPIALIADRFNRRNLIAASLAIWSAMTALSGVASNIAQLALARIGVGVGEAGLSPPAHSIISDLYPPQQRSTAMGIFTLGISLGIMIAYLAGGWVVQNIGWREAFFVVGIPGVMLAIVVLLTVKEPVRGASEKRSDSADRPGIVKTGKYLSRRRSFIHMGVGAGLASFVGYANASFLPSFLVRTHGMAPAEIGLYLGLIIGIAGGLGYVGGGFIADRVSRHDRKFSLWVVSATMLIAWLFYMPVFIVDNPYLALAVLVVPAIFSNSYLATTLAHTQSLVGLRMRGVASAVVLLIINIIGLGLGPQVAGILSDSLSTQFGSDSMRYSLLIIAGVVTPWCALHYFLASRHLNADLDRAID